MCTICNQTSDWLTRPSVKKYLRKFRVLTDPIKVYTCLDPCPNIKPPWKTRSDFQPDIAAFFHCNSNKGRQDGIHLCLDRLRAAAEKYSVPLISLIQYVLLHELSHAYLHESLPVSKRHGLAPRFTEEAFAEYVACQGTDSGEFWLPDLTTIRGSELMASRPSQWLIHGLKGPCSCHDPYHVGATIWYRDKNLPLRSTMYQGTCPPRLHALRDMFGEECAGQIGTGRVEQNWIERMAAALQNDDAAPEWLHFNSDRHTMRWWSNSMFGTGRWPAYDGVRAVSSGMFGPCKRYPIFLHIPPHTPQGCTMSEGDRRAHSDGETGTVWSFSAFSLVEPGHQSTRKRTHPS